MITVISLNEQIRFTAIFELTTIALIPSSVPLDCELPVAGVEGLSPVVTIYDHNGTVVLSGQVGGEVGNGLYEYTMDADDSPGAGYYWAEFVTDSTDVDSRTVTDYIYIVGEGYRMRHGKHFTDQVQQPYRDTQFDTNLTGE